MQSSGIMPITTLSLAMLFPFLTSARRFSRCLLALWSCTLGLMACGQPASAPAFEPTPVVCKAGSRTEVASLRILVSFHQPTVGDAPAVLARLQVETGACVHPVSGISPTLHAYAIDTTANIAVVSERLLRWPAVKAVEADALVQRH
jgi:hypothetical protein